MLSDIIELDLRENYMKNTPLLQTKRLILRQFTLSDLEAFYLIGSDEEVVKQLRESDIPYITATHDINNPRSGNVMKRIGMTYCYSYEELWQPKNRLVTFRMYQLNLCKADAPIYQRYWNMYPVHFIEKDV